MFVLQEKCILVLRIVSTFPGWGHTGQLLKRVLAGKLQAYHPQKTVFPLRQLWFAAEDVNNLDDVIKEEHGWFTKSEVKAYLNVGWRVITHLIEAGFLYPVMKMGQKQFFCRADVQALAKRLIFAGEMTRLLEVPASCIAHLVRKGTLHAVSKPTTREKGCYIFDRAYFMTWHQEHILMPEMRTLISDLKALQRRLKAKGIEPIVKFPNVYCRKEVMGVINQ